VPSRQRLRRPPQLQSGTVNMTRSFPIRTSRIGPARWLWVRIHPDLETLRAAARRLRPGEDFAACYGCVHPVAGQPRVTEGTTDPGQAGPGRLHRPAGVAKNGPACRRRLRPRGVQARPPSRGNQQRSPAGPAMGRRACCTHARRRPGGPQSPTRRSSTPCLCPHGVPIRRATPHQRIFDIAFSQLRPSGAGGTRTRDRGIMSPLL
jgi:hypothetical protein